MKRNLTLIIGVMFLWSCGGGGSQTKESEPVPPLTIPSNVDVTADNGKVSLSWSLSDSSQQSDIYLSTNQDIQYENYSSFENSRWIQKATSPYEYTPEDLSFKYFFVIVAKSAGKESEQSQTVSAVPRYVDQGDSIADLYTSLVWLKCSLGQTYNSQSNSCDGVPTRLSHDETQTVISNDYPEWRLPSASELFSLIYCDSGSPDFFLRLEEDSCTIDPDSSSTIYEEFFPNTKVDNTPYYRTSTRLSVAGFENSRIFQTMNFTSGKSSQINASEPAAFNVRLVKPL